MTHPNTSYSGPLWHVAMVESRGEIDVAAEIHTTLGFPVFVPAERVWTMQRKRRVVACKPMFAGYIFPCVDPYREDWQRILDIDGVIDVLGRPHCDTGRPSYVPTAWVEAMRRAQDMGAFDRTKVAPDGFQIGDMVTITDGPLAGLQAEIVSFIARMRPATARKRAKLISNLLGRMTAIEMPVTSLEKV